MNLIIGHDVFGTLLDKLEPKSLARLACCSKKLGEAIEYRLHIAVFDSLAGMESSADFERTGCLRPMDLLSSRATEIMRENDLLRVYTKIAILALGRPLGHSINPKLIQREEWALNHYPAAIHQAFYELHGKEKNLYYFSLRECNGRYLLLEHCREYGQRESIAKVEELFLKGIHVHIQPKYRFAFALLLLRYGALDCLERFLKGSDVDHEFLKKLLEKGLLSSSSIACLRVIIKHLASIDVDLLCHLLRLPSILFKEVVARGLINTETGILFTKLMESSNRYEHYHIVLSANLQVLVDMGYIDEVLRPLISSLCRNTEGLYVNFFLNFCWRWLNSAGNIRDRAASVLSSISSIPMRDRECQFYIAALVECGADLNEYDITEMTPLQANYRNRTYSSHFFDAMVCNGANPNQKLANGSSPWRLYLEDYRRVLYIVKHCGELNALDSAGKRPVDYIIWPSNNVNPRDFLRGLAPLLIRTKDLAQVPPFWRVHAYALLGRHEELQRCGEYKTLKENPDFQISVIQMALSSSSELTLQICLEGYQMIDNDIATFKSYIENEVYLDHQIEAISLLVKHGKGFENAFELIRGKYLDTLSDLEKLTQRTGWSVRQIIPLIHGILGLHTIAMIKSSLKWIQSFEIEDWKKMRCDFEKVDLETFEELLTLVPKMIWYSGFLPWAFRSALKSTDSKWVGTLLKVQTLLLEEKTFPLEAMPNLFHHLYNQGVLKERCLPDDAYRSLLSRLDKHADWTSMLAGLFEPSLKVEREWVLTTIQYDWKRYLEWSLQHKSVEELECILENLDRMILDQAGRANRADRLRSMIKALRRWKGDIPTSD